MIRPHGRPNELEPALLVFAHDAGPRGFTLPEAALGIPAVASGRKTYRAMALAADRMVTKGILEVARDGGRHPRFRYVDL